MKIKLMKESIEIPSGVDAKIDNGVIEVKGKQGTVKRRIAVKNIRIEIKDKMIEVSAENARKNQKTNLYTYAAHIRNMMKGVTEGYIYTLKICASHFPMNVSVAGGELVVKNFIGEKVPRRLKLPAEVKVKVEGDIVRVEGADKEITGQCAASIEQLTRRPGFDKRIFQDGIYIIEKHGKKLK
ncbi:50S ribosomal protein L6 [Candidatus Woesearchaeota archaeon]|nr:50S ribosomal protein L6 [Candidatus Woesearchaeota archaeon]